MVLPLVEKVWLSRINLLLLTQCSVSIGPGPGPPEAPRGPRPWVLVNVGQSFTAPVDKSDFSL